MLKPGNGAKYYLQVIYMMNNSVFRKLKPAVGSKSIMRFDKASNPLRPAILSENFNIY